MRQLMKCLLNCRNMKHFFQKIVIFLLQTTFAMLILVTAIGGRPKPELCFLPGRLKRMLLPKERYGI